MIRKSLLVLLCAVMLAPSIAWAQDAKAFLGDWVLTIEGRRGPQERPLTIKDTAGKLSAVLGGGRGGAVTITDVTVKGSDATLKWNQDDAAGRHPDRDDADAEGRRADREAGHGRRPVHRERHRQEEGLTLLVPACAIVASVSADATNRSAGYRR